MNKRRTILRAVAACVCLVGLSLGFAQTYPSKGITIVVPFPAGGTTDQVARVIAQKLSESLGQSAIVDNRPGGGGQIAASVVKQAPPDGHTLFIADTGALAINQSLYRKLSYDPLKDFQAITNLVGSPLVLVVPKDSPANSVSELLALAKKKGLNYASQGVGTVGHLLAELFKTKTGADLNHVPYKGSAPALTDLIGGQVNLLFDPVITAAPHVQGGKLKALAIAAPRRSPLLPEVPTFDELGYQGLSNASVWFGIVARAGTPEPIIRKLNEEIVKALKSPDVVKRFTEQGLEVLPTTPEQFATFTKEESARWGPVVKASGATVD